MAKKEEGHIDSKKNVVIVILAAICMLLIALSVFLAFDSKTISGSGKFLQSAYTLQSKISTYIGKSSSDTFGIYTNEELITGKVAATGEDIKDNEDNSIKPLVDIDKKIEKDGKVAYKINEENLKDLLNTSMPTYDGIEFYIQDGELLKVNLTSSPDWWMEDLDFLLVGNE
mgnify:CR=1 FL=1